MEQTITDTDTETIHEALSELGSLGAAAVDSPLGIRLDRRKLAAYGYILRLDVPQRRNGVSDVDADRAMFCRIEDLNYIQDPVPFLDSIVSESELSSYRLLNIQCCTLSPKATTKK